jgi:hypothetical protein
VRHRPVPAKADCLFLAQLALRQADRFWELHILKCAEG